MPDAPEPKILPLRAFKLLRNEEYPNFAVLELTTPQGPARYAVTRDILETLAANMTRAASNMPKVPAGAPAAAPAAAGAAPAAARGKAKTKA
jgi:hypothetical protein